MDLNPFDIGVFLAFIGVVIAFSMFKSRREKTSEDYFLAGRGLTWPLIGLSIVAANISPSSSSAWRPGRRQQVWR
jgi:SSS family solute:Na+ symporter